MPGNTHHQTAEGRTRCTGMAGGDAGSVAGCGARRPDDAGADLGVMRALSRHVERVFNPSRKEMHWGRRKLARDR